jgi:hypothetical protein
MGDVPLIPENYDRRRVPRLTQHSAAGVVAIVFKQLEDFVAVSETVAMGLHCVA